MGLRFRKSVKVGPVRLTASKSGVSTSVGVGGARVTKRADGRIQTTAGIKGTGVYYTEVHKTSSNKSQISSYEKPVKKHSFLKNLLLILSIILGICLLVDYPFFGIVFISVGIIGFIIRKKNSKKDS